jgi:glycerol kinase
LWCKDLKAFDQEMVECDQIFTPQMNEENRKTKLDQWHSALKQA